MTNFQSVLTDAIKRRRRSKLPSGYSLLLDAADTNSYPGSGTSWFDLSGNNNTATLQTGMTWNAGGYMEFDGVTSGGYGSINHSANLTPTTGFTVLVWCYPTTLDGTNARWLMSKRIDTTAEYSYATFIFSDNQVYGDIGGFANRYPSNAGLAVNYAWQHFAICWSGNDQTITFYKNGVIDKVTSGVPSNILSRGANVLIGAGASNPSRYGGRMGVIAYYNNRALTDPEILQAYNTHKSRYGL